MMTPEKAKHELVKDAMFQAVGTILHNAHGLGVAIANWTEGPPPKEIAEHAGMIVHVAEAIARTGDEVPGHR
jgi:hypothetical protein